MGILGIVPKKKKKKEVWVFRIKEVWVILNPAARRHAKMEEDAPMALTATAVLAWRAPPVPIVKSWRQDW